MAWRESLATCHSIPTGRRAPAAAGDAGKSTHPTGRPCATTTNRSSPPMDRRSKICSFWPSPEIFWQSRPWTAWCTHSEEECVCSSQDWLPKKLSLSVSSPVNGGDLGLLSNRKWPWAFLGAILLTCGLLKGFWRACAEPSLWRCKSILAREQAPRSLQKRDFARFVPWKL